MPLLTGRIFFALLVPEQAYKNALPQEPVAWDCIFLEFHSIIFPSETAAPKSSELEGVRDWLFSRTQAGYTFSASDTLERSSP